MDQVKYRTLTRVVAVIDVIYTLAFLLLYVVIFINGSGAGVASVKDESSDGIKNGTITGLNSTIEEGGESDESSSVDVFVHLLNWICFAAICLLMLAQLWAAVKLLLSTRQGQNEAPELALRMARLWRNFHIVLLVLLALGFFLGYHWLDLVLYAVEPAVVVTVASMFAGQLVTFLKSPV